MNYLNFLSQKIFNRLNIDKQLFQIIQIVKIFNLKLN